MESKESCHGNLGQGKDQHITGPFVVCFGNSCILSWRLLLFPLFQPPTGKETIVVNSSVFCLTALTIREDVITQSLTSQFLESVCLVGAGRRGDRRLRWPSLSQSVVAKSMRYYYWLCLVRVSPRTKYQCSWGWDLYECGYSHINLTVGVSCGEGRQGMTFPPGTRGWVGKMTVILPSGLSLSLLVE